MNKIAIFGVNGAIGNAFVSKFLQNSNIEKIYTFSRSPLQTDNNSKVQHLKLNITNEKEIIEASNSIQDTLDLIIIATGILHNDKIQPEKTYANINIQQLETNFLINTISPALIIKHFIKFLPKDKKSIIGVLTARVGSISDNKLGGWYSYRASKAALNMLIKTFSIELSRKLKQNIIVGLHPGTVDSDLSKPFQGFVPKEKLFSPSHSVNCLMNVLENLDLKDTGKIFDWQGLEIAY